MSEIPRRKPIPAPLPRPEAVGLAPRPLAPARSRVVLPTIAALLATTALACQRDPMPLDGDPEPARTHLVAPPKAAPTVEPGTHGLDPLTAAPGMGALEAPPPEPVVEKPVVPVLKPPTKPPSVKGKMAPVHPTPPPVAGGISPIHVPPAPSTKPPIAPTAAPKKLSGDVAAVVPETT